MTILTVCNFDYSFFIKPFLYSLYQKNNMEKINSIFIIDCGIDSKIKNDIVKNKKYNKVIFIEDEKIINSDAHTEKWRNVVSKKLKYLSKLIEDVSEVILIDIDVMFINDMTKLNLRPELDFLLCAQKGFVNNDGFWLDLIGCFAHFKSTEKSKYFISEWVKNVELFEKLNFSHVETPALCYTSRKFRNAFPNYSIGIAPEEKLCSPKGYNYSSLSLHFRSDPPHTDGDMRKRVKRVIGDEMIQHIFGCSLSDMQNEK